MAALSTSTAIEKPLLSRGEISDRFFFYRSAQVMGDTAKITHIHLLPLTANISIKWPVPKGEAADQRPAAGDNFFIVFEVMKDTKHPASFFRLSEFGCWSNWEDVNAIAVKMLWKGKDDETMNFRYLQMSAEDEYAHAAPGGSDKYRRGTLLFMNLMNAKYPEVQEWVGAPIFTRQVQIKTDAFNQEIIATRSDKPLAKLIGPRFSLEVPAKRMRDLGLENVNGAWRSLTWGWVDKLPIWGEKRMQGVSKQAIRTLQAEIKNRRDCDRCFLIKTVLGDADCDCQQVGSVNRCQECVNAGLPCSWTNTQKLGGPTFMDAPAGASSGGLKRMMSGEFFERAMKALVAAPYVADACKKGVGPSSIDMHRLVLEELE
ncbi:hypothetical protein BDY17DRAFT_291673 [Neohortaea acidophila]|uniref:Uncharacterized protein n=1 Tax=Neohortaea acidophila TaxID=245834 RepID=A0A6A6Q206_9PEZI|nr:uncharacterized protein BDY17DRAFT_291673 [Neohortaea acidophila]KAF2486538.1 hypothetical protein BDY17DRAFT_291673 [Neohortaea acidophila]